MNTDLITISKSEYDNLKKQNKDLQEQVKFLLAWKRQAVTCQECYDEGIVTGKAIANKGDNT